MKLLLGRAGSGKTTQLLRRIAAQPEKRHILIVPELASHEYERMLARETRNTGARFAEALTFRRIANRVFSETGGLADVSLTPAGRLLVLYEAVRRSADALTVYGGATRKPEVLRELLDVLDEMKCAGVGAEELLRAANEAEGHLAAKLHDLAALAMQYTALTGETLPDPRDLLTRVCERLPQSTLFDGAEVYLDRFDSFNRQELDILGALLRKRVPLTVALTVDPARPEQFPEGMRAIARLRALAGRCGEPVEQELCEGEGMPRPHDLAVLERYGLAADGTRLQSEDGSVRLYAAGDSFSACEYAAGYIRRLLREGNVRRRDIVVTARNFEQYAPALELVFARYDIPIFLSEKHDILEKPVLSLVRGALRTVTGGWRYEDIFAYLKTGLAGLTPEECDKLENYALFWRIRGKKWREPFTGHPDRFSGTPTEDAAERLTELNALRERAAQPLLALKDGLDAAKTATGYVQALYDFLERIGAPESIARRAAQHEDAGRLQTAEEYRQLWDILVQAMEQFAWVQGEAPMETDTFVTLFGLVLLEYDVGTIPVSLDRVTCGSIDRVCRTGIPHLIVLGVNDGVLPAAGAGGGILSESERETLLGLSVELETGEDRIAREQSAIYRVFASARESLLLVWDTVGADGDLRPSYLVHTVRRLLDGVPESSEAEEGQRYRLEAERPRFDLACRAAAGDRSAAAQAALAVTDTPIETIVQSRRGPMREQETIRGLYGDHMRVSASRVDAFYQCRYAYFLRYGLRAKERRRAELDAPETGTFLHYVLEHAMADLRAHGLREPDSREIAHESAARWTQEYVETRLGGLERQTARFRHLFRRLRRMLEEILDNLLDELACSDFEPIDFELDFSRDLPPIRLDERTGLELTGKVDRVDGFVRDGKLYVRVVDYKSGSKQFELSDLWYGLNVQLLVYLFAIEGAGAARYRRKLAQQIDEIVPAGALYVPAKNAIVQAPRDADEAVIDRLRRRQLRRSGLLLDDRAVIEAMEHGITRDAQYLPVGYVKSGAASAASAGSLASLEQMGKLDRHLRRVLREMGQALERGDVKANPVKRGPGQDVCAWCPYRAVCRFDARLGDKPHTVAKIPPEEFWREIDEELGE